MAKWVGFAFPNNNIHVALAHLTPFEREIIEAFCQLRAIGGIAETVRRDHRKLLTRPELLTYNLTNKNENNIVSHERCSHGVLNRYYQCGRR
jgi:hypothetical protein